MKAHRQMTGLKSAIVGSLIATFLAATAPAMATIIVAGISFEDDAFADVLLSSSDLTQFTISGAPSVEAALTGSDVNTTAFSTVDGAFVELGFTDNLIVNGIGNDLAVFELNVSTAEDITVTINGMLMTQSQVDTGFDNIDGFDVFMTQWDLSDFGIAPGGTVSSGIFQGECNQDIIDSGASCTLGALIASGFVAVGALNSVSVPEPSTLMLLGIGLAGLGWVGRRKRKDPSSY